MHRTLLVFYFKYGNAYMLGFLGDSDYKGSACDVREWDSIPELGRSPGEGNGNPLQYSYLENSMAREA